MGRHDASWNLGEGDPITDELTAMQLLGGGNAYEAYLAFDEITYAPVVVKMLRPDQVSDETSLRGLRREVATLAEVNHPVVVRGLRHELEGERPHVVLEHIDGPRLSSLIRRYGPLQEQQYLPLAIDIASALHYLRHVDVVHLDIKPSNIIMGAPARLIDLSIARSVGRAPRASTTSSAPTSTSRPSRRTPAIAASPARPATSGASARPCSRRSPATAPFDDGDPDAARLEDRFPQLVDEPYELPDRVPDEVAQDPVRRPRARPGRPAAAARARRARSSRCWPGSRRPS